MPNAKDAKQDTNEKFLIIGNTGSGKTTLFSTLPGKKFAYLFDPNAINSLRGCDVDYEEFSPGTLSLSITSLAKGKGDNLQKKVTSDIYNKWEADFEGKLASGFFDPYQNIMFDSCTTLLDLIMDRVLTINGRGGQWPQQDDYGPQMNTFSNIVRTVVGMGKTIVFTAHAEINKDELSGRIFTTPMMTGKLKGKMPLLFSEIYFAEAIGDSRGDVKYTVQTKPDRMNPLIRCTIPGLDFKQDVTIDMSKPREEQGLGAILKKRR